MPAIAAAVTAGGNLVSSIMGFATQLNKTGKNAQKMQQETDRSALIQEVLNYKTAQANEAAAEAASAAPTTSGSSNTTLYIVLGIAGVGMILVFMAVGGRKTVQ